MEITVYGSGQEVGKSCIVVDGKLMLDCGVKIDPEPPTYPDVPAADAAILTHAHLDHSGAAPLLYRHGKKPPVFMTDLTFSLAKLLVKDAVKVAMKTGFDVPFTGEHMRAFFAHSRRVPFRKPFRAASFRCALYRSGHIPGSSSALVRSSRTLFYSSDIQTATSMLLKRNVVPEKCDTLIIESTYSHKERPAREREIHRLHRLVDETIAAGGTILLPAFSVGRSQELMLLLKEYADKIMIDGMARKAANITLEHPHHVRNAPVLRATMKRVAWVREHADREAFAKHRPIIISSAGMLGGGPAVYYLEKIKNDVYSTVCFTGFLAEASPGRRLLASNLFEHEGKRFHVKCKIAQVELSAHADRRGLMSTIQALKPKTVLSVHGDHCPEFAKEITAHFKIDAYAPKNGETVRC